MELILYKDPKEFYLTKLLEKICSKYTGVNVKLPFPQEINEMIYSYTDFITCLNNNCSDYILDKFYNNNRCVRFNVDNYSLNYKHYSFDKLYYDELYYEDCNCDCDINCCFNSCISDTTKFKIFKYSIKKNKTTICDFNSFKFNHTLNHNTNLYEFILHNRVFIKGFNVTDYNIIKNIFDEIKSSNIYTFSTNYNVLRILVGMTGLSYSS
jgi:hypothetical protein